MSLCGSNELASHAEIGVAGPRYHLQVSSVRNRAELRSGRYAAQLVVIEALHPQAVAGKPPRRASMCVAGVSVADV